MKKEKPINLTKVPDPSKIRAVELVIGKKDGTIDNASIPVRWCLTKALLDEINASSYHSPQVCIQVEYQEKLQKTKEEHFVTFREERHLFSLDQFIAYIPLSKPGLVSISLYIIGITQGELKCYSRALLMKDSCNDYVCDHLDTRVAFNVMSNTLKGNIVVHFIKGTLDYRINIPADIFGKKPPQWILNIINRYEDVTLADECALRRRYLLFFIWKIWLIIPEMIWKFSTSLILTLVMFFVGFVDIPWYFLVHPLTYNGFDIKKNQWKHYIDFKKNLTDMDVWEFIVAGISVVYRVPIIFAVSVGLVYISPFVMPYPYNWVLYLLSPLIMFTCIAIIISIILVVMGICKWINHTFSGFGKVFVRFLNWCFTPIIWISDKFADIIIALDDRANRKNKSKLLRYEKYLTCNNDPHSVTANVDEIPFMDRTPSLIYNNFKNKVCKPLSR